MRAVALIIAIGACAPAVPAEPTWVEDVQPILLANCARCHGSEPIFGAPSTFRLDVYDDEDLGNGRVRRGARSMAEFLVARAVEIGDMPAEGPGLSARASEILEAWLLAGRPVGARAGNAAPTVTLDGPRSGDQALLLTFTVHDDDRDSVRGTVRIGDAWVHPLHDGRQTVMVDTGVLPAGTYDIRARVNDSQGDVDVDLGEITVAHATDNVAPAVTITAPLADAIFSDLDTAVVSFTALDPDSAVLVDVEAFRDGEVIEIATAVPASPGGNDLVWDTTGVTASPSWRLRVTARDGEATRTVVSAPFIVSHVATEETWDSVGPIFVRVCGQCHSQVLSMGPDFRQLGDVLELRGLVYRKVVQRREMPPPSLDVVVEAPERITEEERARLGDWLLGGSPE
jgi:hypothetical protein